MCDFVLCDNIGTGNNYICQSCLTAMYCSDGCRKADWYYSHEHDCNLHRVPVCNSLIGANGDSDDEDDEKTQPLISDEDDILSEFEEEEDEEDEEINNEKQEIEESDEDLFKTPPRTPRTPRTPTSIFDSRMPRAPTKKGADPFLTPSPSTLTKLSESNNNTETNTFSEIIPDPFTMSVASKSEEFSALTGSSSFSSVVNTDFTPSDLTSPSIIRSNQFFKEDDTEEKEIARFKRNILGLETLEDESPAKESISDSIPVYKDIISIIFYKQDGTTLDTKILSNMDYYVNKILDIVVNIREDDFSVNIGYYEFMQAIYAIINEDKLIFPFDIVFSLKESAPIEITNMQDEESDIQYTVDDLKSFITSDDNISDRMIKIFRFDQGCKFTFNMNNFAFPNSTIVKNIYKTDFRKNRGLLPLPLWLIKKAPYGLKNNEIFINNKLIEDTILLYGGNFKQFVIDLLSQYGIQKSDSTLKNIPNTFPEFKKQWSFVGSTNLFRLINQHAPLGVLTYIYNPCDEFRESKSVFKKYFKFISKFVNSKANDIKFLNKDNNNKDYSNSWIIFVLWCSPEFQILLHKIFKTCVISHNSGINFLDDADTPAPLDRLDLYNFVNNYLDRGTMFEKGNLFGVSSKNRLLALNTDKLTEKYRSKFISNMIGAFKDIDTYDLSDFMFKNGKDQNNNDVIEPLKILILLFTKYAIEIFPYIPQIKRTKEDLHDQFIILLQLSNNIDKDFEKSKFFVRYERYMSESKLNHLGILNILYGSMRICNDYFTLDQLVTNLGQYVLRPIMDFNSGFFIESFANYNLLDNTKSLLTFTKHTNISKSFNKIKFNNLVLPDSSTLLELLKYTFSVQELSITSCEYGNLDDFFLVLLRLAEVKDLSSKQARTTFESYESWLKNKVKHIYNDFKFSYLNNLRTIRLEQFYLGVVPKVIWYLKTLKDLVLINNGIKEFDFNSVGSLDYIRTIIIEKNSLSKITKISKTKPSIENISLSNNKIDTIENGTFINYTNLVTLDISHNKLTSLPLDLIQLNKLHTLRLNSNNFSNLPSFYVTNSLVILDLSNTKLVTLPPKISTLINLVELDISFNAITRLNKLSKLINLYKLEASGNNITSITPLYSLKKLGSLNVSNNKIVDIIKLSDLKNLEILNLSFNEIETVPSKLLKLKNLIKLDLSHNKLKSMPRVNVLKSTLIQLNLSHNNITTLPNTMLSFNLMTLDLSFNDNINIAHIFTRVLPQRLILSKNQIQKIKKYSKDNKTPLPKNIIERTKL